MAASLEEFVELLSSEQHVDIGRLRHLARHGIHPAVRGEVWMYLLGVLSADKSQEMTSVRALYNTYDALLSHSKVDPQVRASIQAEADRTWRTRVPAPSATSGDASQSMPKTREGAVVAQQEVPVVARKKRSQLVPVAPMNLEPSGWPSTRRASGAASHPPSPGLPPSSSTSSSSSSSSSSLSSPSSSQAAAAAPPPLSAAQREHEERREAFIRRVTNIVGVYISKKAHDKCEAKRLRRRLADEQHRRQNSRKGGEEANDHDSGSEKSDSTHRCARAERSAAPSSPLPQLSFDHARSSSSSSSRSPRRSFSGTSSEGSSQRGANGFGAEEQEEDEEEEEDPESPSEPLFDPAMGMGVDESPIDGEYPDELTGSTGGSRYGSSMESSSRSRGSSKKGTPRIGGSGHLYGEDDGLDATPRRSHPSRRHRKLGHSRHSSESDGSASADEGLNAHRRQGRAAHIGLGLDGTADHLTPTAARSSRSGSRTPSQAPLSPTPLGGRHHHSRSGYSSPLRRDGSSIGSWRKAASPTFQPSSPTSHSRSRPSSRFRRRPSGGAHPRSLSSPGPRSDHDDNDSNSDSGSSSSSSSSSSSILLDEEEAAQQRRLYAPHLVHLASPLVLVSLSKRVEAGVYFAFARLVSLLRPPPSLAHQLSVFHSLFRRTLPDLKAYFEEEGLDVTPFVATWLQGLFAGGGMRLGEGGVLRLWDAYFARIRTEDGHDDEHKRDAHHQTTSSSNTSKPPSSPPLEAEQPGVNSRNHPNPSSSSRSHHPSHDHHDRHRQSLNPAFSDREPLSLHIYVCLSVLQHCKDTLEELDGSECESLLRNLPSQGLEVDKILSEAVNLRLGHRLAVEAAASAARPVAAARAGRDGGVDEDGGEEEEEDDDEDKEADRLAWGLQPLFVGSNDQADRSSGEEDDFSDDDDNSTSEHSHTDHANKHAEPPASNAPSPTTLRHREALLSSLPGEGDLDPLLARHVWTAVKGAADREKRSRSKSHGSTAGKGGRRSSSSASEGCGREAIRDDDDDDSDGRYEDDDWEADDDDDDDAEDASPVPQRPALVSSSSTGGSSMRRFSLEDDDGVGGGAEGGH